MSRYQAAAVIIGLLFSIGYGAAGVAVFWAWLDGVPPGGLAATVAALSAFVFACRFGEHTTRLAAELWQRR